ncbi:DUF6992 family protein [Runella aurantiaca]|uniref:Uncharacterized protein n=1 Tax=Runella aurantiaca TaxID=2282308 RepID=A0A369IG16_9BACT|nr:hypothetical protein [Runella aurantiaca]RDB07165.1 hypothetical protein DVG78_03845 [Runella aurantiaca]
MKKSLIGFLMLFAGIQLLYAQSVPTLPQLTERQARLQRTGTWTLAGWSLANLAVSGIAIGKAEGSARYFHEMNLYWNAVNVGIAGAGLLSLRKKSPSPTLSSAVKEHYTLQKTLLFNSGLDVAYITSGFWLLDKSKTETTITRQNRFRGFGQAVVVQGGFLLIFDVTNYLLHRSDNARLHQLLDKVSLNGNGVTLQF